MTDFQSLYVSLGYICPRLAEVPAKPTIAFARLLERATAMIQTTRVMRGSTMVKEKTKIVYFWRRGEEDRMRITSAFARFARHNGFEFDISIMQLALLLHQLAHGDYTLCLNLPYICERTPIEETAEAHAITIKMIGLDLGNIVGDYMWPKPKKPEGRLLPFISQLQPHELFAIARYHAGHRFTYPGDFVDALREAHPGIMSTHGPAIDQFIEEHTANNGTFRYGSSQRRGRTAAQIEVNRLVSLIPMYGFKIQ